MAQARAKPSQARISGFGSGLGFLKPEPDKTKPKPCITIDGVDSGEGPYQERADRLIQQIVALQQRNPANILQSPSPPVSPPRIAPAQTTAVSMPSSVYGPQGFGMLRVTGIQERSGAQRCVYFVGIQTLESCRTFCQIQAFVDSDANDGAIFRRLQLAGGPVGRALGAITDRAVFFVGTSDYPIDIAQDYANYQFNFREIASLRDVETSNEGDNPFFPVPISAASSTLLRSQNMDETTPVYVLYVYHQTSFIYVFRMLTPVPENLLPSATFLLPSVVAAMAPPTPFPDDLPDLIAEPPLLQSPQTVSEYLLARFSAEYSQLAVWRACAYGSAYIHCLTERQILRICQSLNIGLLGRTHSPAIIGSMVIRMEDVVATAGINFQTFSTYRTELRLIKEVHVILRRLQRLDALPIAHLPLLDCLEVMLGERIISADATRPVAGSDSVAEAEFSVVRLTIASLMTQVRSIIENFSNV
ncbi:hypothetical protein C8R43DRAFT_953928 [Mycena crocata]|nr:hypothetical protein C8R43DRAFT_953928 [Mycena crocata]